jgi:hypothetical protein
MKNQSLALSIAVVLLIAAFLTMLTGCSVFQSAVPRNTVKLKIPIYGTNGVQKAVAEFEGNFAKDNNLGGATISYDGKTLTCTITNLCNTNSPSVIGTGLQGQADLATAVGTQVVAGVNAGATAVGKVAGTAAGAAVKTP